MAFQGISTGSGPNVGDGDTLIDGALKINSNFSEIYTFLGDGTDLTNDYILTSEVDNSSIEFTSNTLNVKTGGITNDMLAGSIANNKLSNSELSYGGVSLSLGGSIAQPAFDLTNATNYQTSNLSGSIDDNQLASTFIKTSEVDNSSIEFTSSTLNVKTGGITNDMLAGSIADGKLSSTFLKNVSGDTNPSLGGNLDANSNNITNANNISANGTVTAGSGFYIGISDANGSVTNGPITRLSFLGDGNTISVDGNGVVSITIAGVGGGAGGSVGVVNSVNVAEALTSGNRFGGKDFTVDVTMTEEGDPTTQKGIKGILTGSFPVYQEGTISTISVNSYSATNATWTENNLDINEYYDSVALDNAFYGRDTSAIIRPTARGAGNGAGYYIVTNHWSTNAVQTGYRNFRVHFAPSLTSSAAVLFNALNTVLDGNLDGSTYWRYRNHTPLRIHTEGEYTFIETQIRSRIDSITSTYYGGLGWHDETGTFYNTTTSGTLVNYSITSDGKGLYQCHESGGNIVLAFVTYDPGLGSWQGGTQITVTSSGNLLSAGLGYDRPSNRLVLVGTDGSNAVFYAWDIDDTQTNTSNRLTSLGKKTISTGIEREDVQQLSTCGDAGLYLKLDGDFYRYNSSLNSFSFITNPILNEFNDNNSQGQLATAGIGGDGSTTIWCSDRHTGGANRIHSSTDYGSTWSTSNNNSYSDTDYNVVPPGAGLGQVFLQGAGTLEAYPGESGSYNGTDFPGTRVSSFSYLTQSATVSNLSNFSVGHRVALKGDETNPDYRGIVSGKTGTNILIDSNLAYNNGDTVLNLSNFTSGQSNRYLNLLQSGAVTSIEQGDPGFVNLGSGLSFNLSFPGSLGGVDTESVIPIGTSLKVQVQCNNSAGDSNIVEDTVTPS